MVVVITPVVHSSILDVLVAESMAPAGIWCMTSPVSDGRRLRTRRRNVHHRSPPARRREQQCPPFLDGGPSVPCDFHGGIIPGGAHGIVAADGSRRRRSAPTSMVHGPRAMGEPCAECCSYEIDRQQQHIAGCRLAASSVCCERPPFIHSSQDRIRFHSGYIFDQKIECSPQEQ